MCELVQSCLLIGREKSNCNVLEHSSETEDNMSRQAEIHMSMRAPSISRLLLSVFTSPVHFSWSLFMASYLSECGWWWYCRNQIRAVCWKKKTVWGHVKNWNFHLMITTGCIPTLLLIIVSDNTPHGKKYSQTVHACIITWIFKIEPKTL